MTAVQIHLQVIGVSPQVGPAAPLHCMRETVVFLVTFVIGDVFVEVEFVVQGDT